MNDRCRVSENEVNDDLDQIQRTELTARYDHLAEQMIGEYEDSRDLIDALKFSDPVLLRFLAQHIRARDVSIRGLLPILKAEYLRVLKMEGDVDE